MSNQYKELATLALERAAEAWNKEDLFLKPLPELLSLKKVYSDEVHITINSTGLSLEQKAILEENLLEVFGSYQPSLTLMCFFDSKETFAAISPGTHSLTQGSKAKKIPGVKNIILVSSGKGGVGKSTISCNLAVTLGKLGYKTGLLDADLYGPSCHILLGLIDQYHKATAEKLIPLEAYGIKCASFGLLPAKNSPVLWRGPLISRALKQLLFEVDWQELDYLVIDLPPGTGDIHLTMVEDLKIDAAVIVTTKDLVSLADMLKGYRLFVQNNINTAGLIANMSHFHCAHCENDTPIGIEDKFSEVCKDHNLKILAQIPYQQAISAASNAGEPIVLQSTPLQELYTKAAQQIIETIDIK